MPRLAKRMSKKQSKRLSKKKVVIVEKPVSGQGAYRKSRPVTGRGSYHVGPLEQFGSHVGGRLGRTVGNWFGSGDYVSADGSAVLAPDPPSMVRSGDGSVIITHREYLGDIITSSTPGAFKIESFGLNPSDTNTFPWLGNLTQPNFQQYKFEQLMFEFRTFSSDALNSTNTALGSVFACINYDYSDPDVASRYQVENTDWSRSCKPSESMLIPVECDPKLTGLNSGLLYVINGNTVPVGADPKTYYLGKMFIGTTGMQGSNVNIGSLYVSYRVKLYKPYMSAPLSNALLFLASRTGCTNTNLLGTTDDTTKLSADSFGVKFTSPTVLTVSKSRLLVGTVLQIDLYYSGPAGTANVSRPVLTWDFVAFPEYKIAKGGSVAFEETPSANPNTGITSMSLTIYLKVANNNSDLVFTLAGGNLPTNATTCSLDLKLFQLCGIPVEQIGKYIS